MIGKFPSNNFIPSISRNNQTSKLFLWSIRSIMLQVSEENIRIKLKVLKKENKFLKLTNFQAIGTFKLLLSSK